MKLKSLVLAVVLGCSLGSVGFADQTGKFCFKNADGSPLGAFKVFLLSNDARLEVAGSDLLRNGCVTGLNEDKYASADGGNLLLGTGLSASHAESLIILGKSGGNYVEEDHPQSLTCFEYFFDKPSLKQSFYPGASMYAISENIITALSPLDADGCSTSTDWPLDTDEKSYLAFGNLWLNPPQLKKGGTITVNPNGSFAFVPNP